MGLVFKSLLNPTNGFINNFLRGCGLDFLAKSWLSDPRLAFGTVIAVDIWKGVGYIMMVIMAGLQVISVSYYEAASMDGASFWQKTRHITIPLLAPVLINATVSVSYTHLPTTPDGKIDEAEAERMMDKAIASGVNYIDTAYPYHNGESEPLVGKVLKKYDRSSFYLATKLPLWAVKSVDDAKRIFEEQLQRLQTDYIDFYLLHAVNKDCLLYTSGIAGIKKIIGRIHIGNRGCGYGRGSLNSSLHHD